MNYRLFLEDRLSKLTAENMPSEELKDIAYFCGVEVAKSLMLKCPGLDFRIPKNSLDDIKRSYILERYDGTLSSLRRLAIECDLSQRYVASIVKIEIPEQEEEEGTKQLNIIEELKKREKAAAR